MVGRHGIWIWCLYCDRVAGDLAGIRSCLCGGRLSAMDWPGLFYFAVDEKATYAAWTGGA